MEAAECCGCGVVAIGEDEVAAVVGLLPPRLSLDQQFVGVGVRLVGGVGVNERLLQRSVPSTELLQRLDLRLQGVADLLGVAAGENREVLFDLVRSIATDLLHKNGADDEHRDSRDRRHHESELTGEVERPIVRAGRSEADPPQHHEEEGVDDDQAELYRVRQQRCIGEDPQTAGHLRQLDGDDR